MKNFTFPNVAKQAAQHFIKFRKTRHPYAIWVNQIATGRRGVFLQKSLSVKPRQKPPKMLSGHFGGHLPWQLVFNVAVV
jgi:hypothetical protein